MTYRKVSLMKKPAGILFLLIAVACTDDGAPENNKSKNILGKLEMVTVEGGSFIFGEWLNQPRTVTLSRFGLSKHEVTRELWHAIMGDDYYNEPWQVEYVNACPTCPIEAIDAPDVLVFLDRMSEMTGKKFRLPTEMEWEFAYRGGNQSQNFVFSGGDEADDVAWYSENAFQPQPVGTKQANELGIYDMEGNVSELCSDNIGIHVGNSVISPQFNNPTGAVYGEYKITKGSSVSCWPLIDGLGRKYLNCSFAGYSSIAHGAAAGSYDPDENIHSPVGFRIAEQLVEEPEIKLGQAYQGGTVVYLDETGQHGLILSDLDAAMSGYDFACPQMQIGTTSENGMENSTTIANSCAGMNTAAGYCLELTYAGYSDWYLPSVHELLKIHYNLGVSSFHQETVLYLMTSNTGISSQHQYLTTGAYGAANVNVEYSGNNGSRFRPVRAF